MAPTRWKLKRAIRGLNQTLNELHMQKHVGKTSIGKIEREFDFLGYHFGPDGIGPARKTVANFLTSPLRPYEQEPGEPFGSSRLGLYVKRWLR